MANKITCKISRQWLCELPYGEDVFVNMAICSKLKECGIPIIGGPLLPKVDFTKGMLVTFDDLPTYDKVYEWTPNSP